MKRAILMMILTVMLLPLAACGAKEEILYEGCDAVITAIDLENSTITVKDRDDQGYFGDACVLDCSEAVAERRLIYCDYDTDDLMDIELDQLQLGDEVIVSIYESELEKAKNGAASIYQLQLGTQRMSK